MVLHPKEFHATYHRLQSTTATATAKTNNKQIAGNKALVEAESALKLHPIHYYYNCYNNKSSSSSTSSSSSSSSSLEIVLKFLQDQYQCHHTPIFLSMASVGSSLYWQLIENFIYTAVKFKYIDCTLVICVSDANCMQLCRDNFFPCFHYITPEFLKQTNRKV